MKDFTCIDLFCGCGGFSLGMQRAGFRVLAAIDFNSEAIQVFQRNFAEVPQVLKRDLTTFDPVELATLIDTREVDVVVGGPPCQGFSNVRQRDGANHGPRLVEDGRRYLYRTFLDYVEYFSPKVFVMENVLGIRSAAGGKYFTKVQEEARKMGYRVHSQIEKAYALGVPQKRQRQLIVGTRLDLPEYFRGELRPVPRAMSSPTLGAAICDLPVIRAGGGEEVTDYDMDRRKLHVEKYGRRYLYETLEVQHASKLTAHRARPHSDRDLRDFSRLREGEHCTTAMKRGEKFEFPYDKGSFKDRYTRQHRDAPCSTIVAHLSKDGLMFVHPTQNRSLTAREAARVQSFPDWFEFPVARTHQFRVIGNAVPPLVAEAVGLAVKSYLEKNMSNNKVVRPKGRWLPVDELEAVQAIQSLVHAAKEKNIQRVSPAEFLRGWYSISFLFSGLHPDSALEHGDKVSSRLEMPAIGSIDLRHLARHYVRSGWPVALAPVAKDAWRRYQAGELKDDEFYCSRAVLAGMVHRNPGLLDDVGQKTEEMLA
ncbi:MAG: DNA cytosine methyltransferase [Tepidisphaeraceae bacterium]|jgi:DNA (cytosine-5)-methyltransferase 1